MAFGPDAGEVIVQSIAQQSKQQEALSSMLKDLEEMGDYAGKRQLAATSKSRAGPRLSCVRLRAQVR